MKNLLPLYFLEKESWRLPTLLQNVTGQMG